MNPPDAENQAASGSGKSSTAADPVTKPPMRLARSLIVLAVMSASSLIGCYGIGLLSGQELTLVHYLTTSLPMIGTMAVVLCVLIQRERSAIKRLQFGLGPLLVAMTFLCIWLAAVNADIRHAQAKNAARIKLQQDLNAVLAGRGRADVGNATVVTGAIGLSDQDLRTLIELVEGPGLRFRYPFYLLDVSKSPQLSDAAFEELARCKRLRYLYVNGTSITDKSLPEMANLPSLEQLCLQDTAVSQSAMQRLAEQRPKLQILGGTAAVPFLIHAKK